MAIAGAALLTGYASVASQSPEAAKSTTSAPKSTTTAPPVSSPVPTTPPSTFAVTTIPIPAPAVTTTTNPEAGILQSEISSEQAVVEEDTSNLQGAEGKLSQDTQWCDDPLDGGSTGEIGLLPCSSQLGIDEGNVSADTQELSYAQATLETEEQEFSTAGG